MKTTEKNALLKKITFDKNLGAPHLRTLLWMMSNKTVRAKDIAEALEMSPQQTNKIINELINNQYIVCVGKLESARVLFYSINSDAYSKKNTED